MNFAGIKIAPKNSPNGDHAANGLAELAGRDEGGLEPVGAAAWQKPRRDRSTARMDSTPPRQLQVSKVVPDGCTLDHRGAQDVGDDIKSSSERACSFF